MLTILGLTAAATGATAKIKALKQSCSFLTMLVVIFFFMIVMGGTVWYLSETWKTNHQMMYSQARCRGLQHALNTKQKEFQEQQRQIKTFEQKLGRINQKLQEQVIVFGQKLGRIDQRLQELITAINTRGSNTSD